jgi:apolipoprotein D and lipocalin family protein
MKALILVLSSLAMVGCASIPDDIEAVGDFNLTRYLGKWYEIARLDHSFERGLSNVSAEYSLRDDGGVNVLNRGFDDRKGEWKEATGRAYFAGNENLGRFSVSFFRPFYGGYNIFVLDREGYAYSVICGNSKSYLWILARTKTLDKERIESLVAVAREKGFDVENLIWVRHDRD